MHYIEHFLPIKVEREKERRRMAINNGIICINEMKLIIATDMPNHIFFSFWNTKSMIINKFFNYIQFFGKIQKEHIKKFEAN